VLSALAAAGAAGAANAGVGGGGGCLIVARARGTGGAAWP
jgi:hypothetical protein